MSDEVERWRIGKSQIISYLMAWGVTPSLGELSYIESRLGSFILHGDASNGENVGIFT